MRAKALAVLCVFAVASTAKAQTSIATVPSADGTPIANAPIALPSGIGQTDDHGYFEVDAAPGNLLTVRGGGDECRIPLPEFLEKGDFVRLGKVVCR